MTFLDVDRRRQLVQSKNRKGHTPLHVAVAFRGGEGADETNAGVKPLVQVRGHFFVCNIADRRQILSNSTATGVRI